MSSPGAVWLSSPTWNSVVVLCGSGIAASEELLGSQGLLARCHTEHLEALVHPNFCPRYPRVCHKTPHNAGP